MNKNEIKFFDKIVMSDRYNGTYTGFRYRIVEKPFESLTQEECDMFNVVIRDGNEFYGRYDIPNDELLTTKNCRIEAVEKTFENGDVYAAAASVDIDVP